MATTQDHIPVEDIKDGIVTLKDGGAAIIIKTSAVNFGLLSAEEQMAIIGSFAQMLNSLSFAIQITLLSKRLDISAYLKLLEKAQKEQTNPLLSQMMIRYRRFIQSLIKDNEVLDKQFYITIPLSPLELGVGYKSKEDKFKKAKTVLEPKRDQVMRQLNRVSLTAKQLMDDDLVNLFFEIYNTVDTVEGQTTNLLNKDVSKAPFEQQPMKDNRPPAPNPEVLPTNLPTAQSLPVNPPPVSSPIQDTSRPKPNHPFVVEELQDSA